jgi:hypothetical protein
MKRRRFLKLGGCASLGLLGRQSSLFALDPAPPTFSVALNGRDNQAGTPDEPFASLHRAQRAVREFRRAHPATPVTVVVRQGTYYLDRTLLFTPEDSGSAQAPVLYRAGPGEKVTLSGGRRLRCQWQTRKSKSICDLNAGNLGPFAFTQLFINGRRQVRARFPDYDAANPARGGFVSIVRALPAGTSSPDPADEQAAASQRVVVGIEFDPDTFSQKRWGTPGDAVIHISQSDDLGMLDWQIRSIDYDRNRIWFGSGGTQLGDVWAGSKTAISPGSRFYVDNVLEEMTVAGEWYLASHSGTLYYRASPDLDLENTLVEVPVLDEIVRVQGDGSGRVEHIAFQGFRFAHTETTYMKPRETAAFGKWAIYRGGAVCFEQTRHCSLRDCWFDGVGGNAVFWSGSNSSGRVTDCKFSEVGDNSICFAGLPGDTEDRRNAPSDCAAVNNLIEGCGVFGKQTAGLYISRAHGITAAHNEFRALPCSAICIADGSWGGHRIENNAIADSVQETQHYAPLNAWGEARRATPEDIDPTGDDEKTAVLPELMGELVIVHGNFIRHQTDCGILLGSGAAHYDVSNNIVAGAAIRIGEGADREIHNNIWYASRTPATFAIGKGSIRDRYHHNIAVLAGETAYALSAASKLTQSVQEIDYNCVFRSQGSFCASATTAAEQQAFDPPALLGWSAWQKLGFDQNSVWADPLLIDPAKQVYQISEDSPARKLGFVSFPMNQWGMIDAVARAWKNSRTS